MIVVAIIFWLSVLLLIYTQIGYGLLLALMDRIKRARSPGPGSFPAAARGELVPKVSVIVAAYREQQVIADKVTNLRELGYPQELVEVIVAVDGGADADADATAARAREAGADIVLELPRGGKVVAQDAAARAATGDILAFSDANSKWHPTALHMLVFPIIHEERVGYVCGNVNFTAEDGADNQEGVYWRYEMFMRARESDLSSITAGNGAIYAVHRDAYMELGPIMSHDIAFPFTMVKRGWKALYAPAARASEKMAPTIDGEFRRKRRMAARSWAVIVNGHMFSPRGYSALYALMIFSHRFLRYLTPLLHVVALIANLVLIGQGWVYIVCLLLQLAVLLAAVAAPLFTHLGAGGGTRAMPLRVIAKVALICRYYVVTNASLALGFWDLLRGRQRVTWEPVEGTR